MSAESLLLRYATPAEHFTSAAMVGNGRLGAVVFGHTHRERIVLNEDSCWAGGPRDRLNPRRAGALARVRELLFAGRHEEADTLAREHLLATPRTIDSYQPMGELALRMGWRAPITDYRRWLDLDGAVAGCEWRENGALHRRLVFASAVDQVLVIRHETDAAKPAPLAFSLEREGPHSTAIEDRGDLLLLGHADARADRYGSDLPNDAPVGQGLPLALRIRRLPGEGKSRVFDGRLVVSEARGVSLLVALATGFRATDPAEACRAALDAAARFSADELLARHQADHRALFRQFHLDLGAPADDGRPLPERLAALRAGAPDPGLLALVVQHRRYLLLAASRPGSLPSNLQGLWTEQRQGPWNCDYHFNINLQMNYWVAEPTGLGECAQPLLDWTESIVPAGERTARELYGCGGWTLHHLSDSWGATEPFDGIWGLWPWGGVWLCLHLHDHWRYSADPAVLDRVWPLLRGATRFALDFLVEGPSGTAHAGFLTTCPSHSPENAFLDATGRRSKFTYGATMDLGLCRALFAACIEELDALGSEPTPPADAALRAEIVAAAGRLPPLAISARTGGIQEWAEDFADADPGHRHVSPLFDLHPGSVISRRHTPELAEAAAATLRRKAAHQADDTHGQPGWTLNWLACLWARLGDGEQAHSRLLRLLTHASTPNLWTFAHDQAQAADTCGTAAAVCEMLVQHHDGVVRLLPALPRAWPRGHLSGLRLPGGVALDLVWENHAVTRAVFTAHRATTLSLALPEGCQLASPRSAALLADTIARLNLRAGEIVTVIA